MSFESLDAYRVHPLKLFALAVAMGSASLAAIWFGLRDVLGAATPEISTAMACLVGYLVVTVPRRMRAADARAQSKEALILSVSAAACMDVTKSKSKTLLLLRGRSSRVRTSLREVRSMILLGNDPSEAVIASTGGLASYTVLEAIEAAASTGPGRPDTEGEESGALTSMADADVETRLPLLMTVCFFVPIMLVLYTVFARVSDARGLAEVACFDFVAVDLAYFFASSARRPL